MIPAGELFDGWRRAPVCDLAEITGGAPLVVLSPHPDDESLGFGGLIARARARGDRVEVAILTDGTGSHPGSASHPPSRLKSLREAETLRALSELGVGAEHVTFLEAIDTKAPREGPEFDALASRIEQLIRSSGAETLLTTWEHDPHCDHEAAALIAKAAAKATGVRLMFAPVWGWTLPRDTALPEYRAIRLHVREFLPAKRRAIAAHVSQMTALIDDTPDAFRLQPEFLKLFDQPWEVLLWS